jgi:hypothetical protein
MQRRNRCWRPLQARLDVAEYSVLAKLKFSSRLFDKESVREWYRMNSHRIAVGKLVDTLDVFGEGLPARKAGSHGAGSSNTHATDVTSAGQGPMENGTATDPAPRARDSVAYRGSSAQSRGSLARQGSKSLVREAAAAAAADADESMRWGRFSASGQLIRVPGRRRSSGASLAEECRRPGTASLPDAQGACMPVPMRRAGSKSSVPEEPQTGEEPRGAGISRARRGSYSGEGTSILEPEGPYLDPEVAEVAFDNSQEEGLCEAQPRHAVVAGSLLTAPKSSAEQRPSWG